MSILLFGIGPPTTTTLSSFILQSLTTGIHQTRNRKEKIIVQDIFINRAGKQEKSEVFRSRPPDFLCVVDNIYSHSSRPLQWKWGHICGLGSRSTFAGMQPLTGPVSYLAPPSEFIPTPRPEAIEDALQEGGQGSVIESHKHPRSRSRLRLLQGC